jgi:predicted nucleic acid-binding protein
MTRYADVPMSLADACLVRMVERHPGTVVFTLDRDFRVYRVHGRRVLSVIMPSDI